MNNVDNSSKSLNTFLINRSDLEGRLDVAYNHAIKYNTYKTAYPEQKLYKICKPYTGGTPSKDIPEYWGGEIPWASPKDFKGLFLNETEDYITEKGLKNSSSKLIPANSVLIVVRSGILAHTLPVTINRVPTAINQDLKAFVVDKSKALPEYLGVYFFVFGKRLLPLITKHSTTVQSVNTDQFAQLKIPLPAEEIQAEIVKIVTTGYEVKQRKQAQANLLLANIDAYILQRLGIKSISKRTDSSKFFISTFSDITGGRFDPKLYEQSTRDLKSAIKSSHFDKLSLKSLIIHSVAGDWGVDDSEDVIEGNQRCLVIRATEFDNDGNLNLNNSRIKYRLISKYKLKRIDIKPNDLLIEKSGGSPDQPVGRIAIITEEMLKEHNICYSNFIHKIRVDESKVLPEYLFYFLKTMHNIKLTDAMQSQTNGIRNLIMSNYFNQDIVLPNTTIQQEMVEKIREMRREIDKLNTEAGETLANAKSAVEQMILG